MTQQSLTEVTEAAEELHGFPCVLRDLCESHFCSANEAECPAAAMRVTKIRRREFNRSKGGGAAPGPGTETSD
jgi:hypothetical protein